MLRFSFGVCVIVAILSACGGGGGGAGGNGGAPVSACPVYPSDLDVQDRLGKPCAMEGEACVSQGVCGSCAVVCTAGTWTKANATVCMNVGNSC
jgi:hypothetical protein